MKNMMTGNRNKLRRFLTLVFALLFSVTAVMAQASGDRLYNQGLALQKTMTVSAQQQAIGKFRGAKKLYDSAAKKAQCDQAITVSNKIMETLKRGGGSGGGASQGHRNRNTEPEKPTKVNPTLSLSNSSFDMGQNSQTVNVTVNTNQDDWTFNTVPCEDGSSFVTAKKTGTSTLELTCGYNKGCKERAQNVQVTTAGLVREIKISQKGRPVDLDAKNKVFSFKHGGGNKDVELFSNSDEQFHENADENWFVLSKPNWVEISIKDKGKSVNGSGGLFGKIGSGIGKLVGKDSDKKEDPYMKKSKITIICKSIRPGSVEAVTGRDGVIEIKSGDQVMELHIHQEPKQM